MNSGDTIDICNWTPYILLHLLLPYAIPIIFVEYLPIPMFSGSSHTNSFPYFLDKDSFVHFLNQNILYVFQYLKRQLRFRHHVPISKYQVFRNNN